MFVKVILRLLEVGEIIPVIIVEIIRVRIVVYIVRIALSRTVLFLCVRGTGVFVLLFQPFHLRKKLHLPVIQRLDLIPVELRFLSERFDLLCQISLIGGRDLIENCIGLDRMRIMLSVQLAGFCKQTENCIFRIPCSIEIVVALCVVAVFQSFQRFVVQFLPVCFLLSCLFHCFPPDGTFAGDDITQAHDQDERSEYQQETSVTAHAILLFRPFPFLSVFCSLSGLIISRKISKGQYRIQNVSAGPQKRSGRVPSVQTISVPCSVPK